MLPPFVDALKETFQGREFDRALRRWDNVSPSANDVHILEAELEGVLAEQMRNVVNQIHVALWSASSRSDSASAQPGEAAKRDRRETAV